MNEAPWAALGIAVPMYARAVRRGHQCKIPAYVLRAYHQSDAWAQRRRAYWATHPKVCVACLWFMPLAFWAWMFRLFFVWFPPMRRLVKRLFRRDIQLHHVTYKGIWDGEMLHPGAEKNRHLGGCCTRLPVTSRLFEGMSHHAAADRVRRLSEKFGLPPVVMFRLWIAKCWAVQIVVFLLLREAAWWIMLR